MSQYAFEITDEHRGPSRSFPLPWRSDAKCFNLRVPKFSVEVSEAAEMLTELGSENMESLFISADLGPEEKKVISQMTHLRYLYIFRSSLADLSIIREMTQLSQLIILDCNVDYEGLQPLTELMKKKMNQYQQEAEGADEREECNARLRYQFEGIFIASRKLVEKEQNRDWEAALQKNPMGGHAEIYLVHRVNK